MPGVASPRTLLASAISCGLHAVLLLLATAVTLPDHVPPQLIRVTLLGIGDRGQGGERGGVPAPRVPPSEARHIPPRAAKPARADRAAQRRARPIQPKPSAPNRVVERPQPASRAQASAVPLTGAAAPGAGAASTTPAGNVGSAESGYGTALGTGNGTGSGSGGGRGDLRAQCLDCPTPTYPRIARIRGWEGTVQVDVILQRDGHVENARIEASSGHEILDSAALAAARQSRFRLATGAITRGRIAYGFRLSRMQ